MPENTLEAKKDGLSQLQDGCWVLKLKVHPDDMLTDLMKLPMGTRLQLAVWLVNDDETTREVRPTNGHKLAMRTAIKCDDVKFRRFLWEKNYIESDTLPTSEEAAEAVRLICGVSSRSNIDGNPDAEAKCRKLLTDYEIWSAI